MSSILKLSWRNIWRNHRRTLITIASVFFAVFFSVLTMAFSNGSWGRMIENMLRTQTGHIQVHLKGYWEDKITDNFMEMDAETIRRLTEIEHVINVSPRIETFAMASSDYNTGKGVGVVGIDPGKEDEKSSLSKRLTEGRYLTSADRGVLIGKALAAYLRVNVGDSLALIGQGYHGAGAIGLYPIRGIVSLATPEMERGTLYMSMPAAQEFIDMPNGYSGILIAIDDGKALEETMRKVSETVDASVYEVLSWKTTMEDLLKQAESDKAFSVIILSVLYLIVGFGILGTVIMMTTERRREFGMMVALGMRKARLARSVALELFLITCIGLTAGLGVSLPIALYFHHHPIPLAGELAAAMSTYGMEPVVPMEAHPALFAGQALTVFLLTALTIFYPVRAILKLDVNKALRA
ncbi:MAG: ABC transporter permease [Tannerellaceae bacterium]|jgi:ABC-type lipoprotein release transport system permease subunit|nr:ABC transporter permease [Tannerellaceae bacterium]